MKEEKKDPSGAEGEPTEVPDIDLSRGQSKAEEHRARKDIDPAEVFEADAVGEVLAELADSQAEQVAQAVQDEVLPVPALAAQSVALAFAPQDVRRVVAIGDERAVVEIDEDGTGRVRRIKADGKVVEDRDQMAEVMAAVAATPSGRILSELAIREVTVAVMPFVLGGSAE